MFVQTKHRDQPVCVVFFVLTGGPVAPDASLVRDSLRLYTPFLALMPCAPSRAYSCGGPKGEASGLCWFHRGTSDGKREGGVVQSGFRLQVPSFW